MTGYYDYVLGLIPAALLGITAFLNLVGLSLTAALPAGAIVAIGLMAHAMFVRNPVTEPGETGAAKRPAAGAAKRPAAGSSAPGGSTTGGSTPSGGSASPGASD